ncbi:MAG: hypothetical protein ACI845_002889 [Gammaproteobacteria bacterium]|jgi:uncharacterized protein (TIGR00369 family)
MDLSGLSGLQILQAIIDGEHPHPGIASSIPMIFREVEAGRVLFEATANKTHLNPMGGTHGGFAATVLDSVTGCAIHSLLEAGVVYGTIELNVKMMRPVPQQVKLFAEGKVINMTRSLGVSEGWLTDTDGKLFAHATSTCMIKR